MKHNHSRAALWLLLALMFAGGLLVVPSAAKAGFFDNLEANTLSGVQSFTAFTDSLSSGLSSFFTNLKKAEQGQSDKTNPPEVSPKEEPPKQKPGTPAQVSDLEAKLPSTQGSQGPTGPTVIERIVERVVQVPVLSPPNPAKPSEGAPSIFDTFSDKLSQLENKLKSEIYRVASSATAQGNANFAAITLSNRINQLTNVTISGATVSGLSGLTDADIPDTLTASNYLPLAGGTLTGGLIGTNATTTNFFATTASSTNLYASNFSLGSLTGFLKATAGTVATALVDLANDVTGILGVSKGGTGWAAIQSGSLVYGNGASAIATTTAGTAGYVLAYLNGTPTWTATSTLSDISGTLTVTKGGTGLTALATGYIPFGAGTSAIATSSSLYFDSATGNLGLGTTSPYAKLSVVGGVVAQYFTATTTANNTFPNLVATNSTTTNATTTNLFSTTASSTNLYTTSLAVGGATLGNTTIGGTLSVSGLASLSGQASTTRFSIFDTLYIGGTATSTLQGATTGTSTLQGFLNILGANSTSTFSGGLAANYLNITGTSATSTFARGIDLAGGCFSVNGTCVGTGVSGTQGQLPFYNTTGTTLTATSTLTLTQAGLFGLGTSTPYSKLSVWGGGTATGQLFELTNSASTTVARFLDNGTAYLLGNLGLGTTSPYAKLSVVGETVSSYFTATSTTATSTFAGILAVGTTTPFSSPLFTVGTSSPLFYIDKTTGNLGLGTSTPTSKLSITGLGTGTGRGLVFADSSNIERFTLLDNGNLGLGTTSPYAKLSVVGEAVAQYFTATSTTATSTFAGGLKLNKAGTGIEFQDGTIQTSASRTPTIQVFTSSGTWTKPSGVTKVKVRLVGGGGGGGGSRVDCGPLTYGGGGGGGGGAEKLINVSAVSSVSVTVGTGGAAGYGGNDCTPGNATAGNTSSFGAYLSATGGGGGAAAGTAGAGGTGSSGDINISGGKGYAGTGTTPGAGNVSMLAPALNIDASTAGLSYGGGGSGGANQSYGGAGATGVVIIDEY